MSTISQIMGINIRPPSSLFSLLPLYEVLLMCKRPYQSFERPAHWPCDRSMKLLSVKPPMTNLWISFFVVTGLFWSTISAELFFFLRRWKCRRLGIEIILPWWLQQKEPKLLKKSQIIVTTSSKWQQLRQSWEVIFKSNKIQQPEDLGYPERYTIQ